MACGLATALLPAAACGPRAGTHAADSGRVADLDRQQDLAFALARRAERIVLARATMVDPPGFDAPGEARRVRLVVDRTMKGPHAATLVQPFQLSLTVSCTGAPPSTSFHDNAVEAGRVYLVYIGAGTVLRAADTRRTGRALPLWAELRTIERALAPARHAAP